MRTGYPSRPFAGVKLATWRAMLSGAKGSYDTVLANGTCEANKKSVGGIETATYHNRDGDFMLLALVGLDAEKGLTRIETTDTCRAYT